MNNREEGGWNVPLKRKKALLLTLLGSALLLAYLNNNRAENPDTYEQNEIVTLTFWDENAGPSRTPLWEEIITNFNIVNDDVRVEYVGIPRDDAKMKMDAAIAADNTPDIASIQTSWLPEFSYREALYPLDSFYEGSTIDGVIRESALETNRKIVSDNHLYGIPYTQNLDVLWIRQDLFEVEGIKEPETWEEFFEAVEAMTTEEMYGYTMRGGAGGSLQLQRLMYAYSGISEYITEDGYSTIDDPMHLEFLERYFSLYEKYTPQSDITNSYNEMVATFDKGKAAMVHHNIGSYANHKDALEKNQFKAIPLPISLQGHHVVEGGNTISVAIFAGTDYPEEAFRFIEFVNSAESQSMWNKEVGQIPTNRDVMTEKWIQDAQHLTTAFSIYENPDTVLYEPPFHLPDYRLILDNQIDVGIQAVMVGEKSVEEFLTEWVEAIETSSEKNKGEL